MARAGTPRTRWHSVSSTREFETCPRRYRFGYVERRPKDRPVPPHWRFGTVVHAGLEAAWKGVMADPDAPLATHLPAAVAAADAAVAAEGLDAADRDRAERILTAALEADVVRARDDGTDDGPLASLPARPIGVEEALRGWAGGDHDRVIGFADLVLEHADGTVELVDHKVTSKRLGSGQLRDDFQLNLYGHLASKRWRDAPRIVATIHYPTGPDAVSVELGAEGMRAADRRVRAAARAIAAETEFAAVPSEACTHCPWQPSCPEGTAWDGGA